MCDNAVENWEDVDKLDYSINEWGKHWGVIPEGTETLPPDFCEKVIMAAVKPLNPKCKLPVTEEDKGDFELPPDIFPINEIVRHTITLNRHVKTIHKLLRIIGAKKSEIRECPPVPEMIVRKRRSRAYKKEKLERPNYVFSLGQSPQYPYLDDDLVHQMLTKAVLIILAQLGFDRTKKSALLVLVDVVKEWLLRMTHICQSLAQHDLNEGRVYYQDVLEHAFRAMGLGTIKCIDEYYKQDVIARRERELAKSTYLVATYTKIANKLKTESKGGGQSTKESAPGFSSASTIGTTVITNISNLLEGSHTPAFQDLHDRPTSTQPGHASDPVPSTSGVTNVRHTTKKNKKSKIIIRN